MQYPGVSIDRDAVAVMRDGCQLRADIYQPIGSGPWPVLLMRQPYGKALASTVTMPHPVWFARHGLIVVVQDVRGRGRSEGEFKPFVHEVEDGYDTVEWAASLPSSNGRVGMYGFSYQGATQLLAARAAPPHLAAICPAMTASDFYDGWTYQGGAFSLAFAAVWALQLGIESATRHGDERAANHLALAYAQPRSVYHQLPLDSAGPLAEYLPDSEYFRWLAHPTFDEYWRSLGLADHFAEAGVPALHIGGWFDSFLIATVRTFGTLASIRPGSQQLIIGPWQHLPWSSTTGGVDWGSAAAPTFLAEVQLAWLRRWLSDDGPLTTSDSPVRVFITGLNAWRTLDAWPPGGTTTWTLFLDSGGRANSLDGNGRLTLATPRDAPPDVYVHDPTSPVPTVGPGPDIYGYEYGPYDRQLIHTRQDVLIYTSPPLEQPLVVLGEPEVVLWAATSGVDADFVLHLSELFADGRARTVSSGILRARYRASFTEPSWMPRDGATELHIRLRPVGHQFRAGSRLRLDLASSSFPLIDRNPGKASSSGSVRRGELEATMQTVFHASSHPSALHLPVVEGIPRFLAS